MKRTATKKRAITKKRVTPKKRTAAKTRQSSPAVKTTDITPACKWTNGGTEVLILKCVDRDGKSYGGFQWPLTVGKTVTAPDWNRKAECGSGLHGWPWGLSMGDGKDPQWDGAWLVFGAQPSGVINLGGKCKTRTAIVRFVGDWQAATNFVLAGQIAWILHASMGAASATGNGGAASATGDGGAASATGNGGAASATGDGGAASATGDGGAASATGDRGAASATGNGGAASATGNGGAASATGDRGAAVVTGINGRAKCGPFGCVALCWWSVVTDRGEMRCREVGRGDGSDGKLKANVWYRLDDAGQFVEAA